MATYNHTGSGGIEVNSSAIKQLIHVFPASGGIAVGGFASVSTSSLLNEHVVGSGGIRVSGSAPVVVVKTGGVLPNKDWLDGNSVEGTFLYGRLHNQKNPLACKDTGPVAIGDLTEDLLVKEWTLIYSPSTGEFYLDDEAEFTWNEDTVNKVDLTFDVWGYPVICWTTTTGRLFLREYSQEFEAWTTTEYETEGCSDCFVCLAERRMPWSYDNNKIFLVYRKDGEILSRQFLDDRYGTPYHTFLTAKGATTFRIEGMGVTEDYRLQVRVNYKYTRHS